MKTNDLRCIIDYETRNSLSIKVVSAYDYAQTADILCVGYKIDDKPPTLWIPERSPMPPDLWEAFQHGILLAHNAGFERAITKYALTRYETLTPKQRKILANIPISRWRCTAAKAAACSLPRSLDAACEALDLVTKKDKEGSRLIQKYCKPRKPSKKDKALWWHASRELRGIYRYCLTDVQAEYELDQALPDLTDYEQKVWELDQEINDEGIMLDIPTVKIILEMIDEEIEEARASVKTLSGGELYSATQTGRLLEWLNTRGADMTNLQAQTLRDKLEEKDLSYDIRRMLECRQTMSRTSTAKYLKMIQVVSPDDRARELLLYNGTMPTGRWAGKRLNPQNFPRGEFKIDQLEKAIRILTDK